MNIIHIPRRFTRESWGGTETVVLETSKHLQRAGHHVRVLTSQALSDRSEEMVEGVPVTRAPHFYPYLGLRPGARQQLDRRAGNLFSFALLRKLFAEKDTDLFHLHTGKRLGGIVRAAARHRQVPYVVSLHGGVYDVPDAERQSWTDPTAGAFEWGRALGWAVGSRRVLDDAAAILCLSDEERRQVEARHPTRRIDIIPNGVDASRFAHGDGLAFRRAHGIPEDRPVILTVARIDGQKNQRLAVQVLSRLREQEIDAQLVLIGPSTQPAYAESLAQDIATLGLRDRVSLVGAVDPASSTLCDAYHAASLLLLPSRHEPFGIVLLEAWAAGRPVVASRVGGIPGVASHGVDSLLFDADDVGDAVRAVASVLLNPALAERLGRQGRKKVIARYDWSVVTRQVEQVYDEVIRARAVRQ